jgi:GT2 family glycosyltransferase
LHSLIEGSQQPQEIIIVGRKGDTLTEDVTIQLHELCKHKTSLRVGWVERAGYPPPVEKGLALACCDIVAIVDDDVTVTPDWLVNIVRPFADPSVGVVGGQVVTPGGQLPRIKGRPGCISWYGKLWGNVASLQGIGPIEVRGVTEGNWAWRRSLLSSIKFDPLLNFDDAAMYGLDLCLQARDQGHRVIYDSRAILYHHNGPRPPGLDRRDRPRRIYSYTRNYTYIMLKHLPWWQWPVFMSWWFLIGERGGWGFGSVLADTLLGRRPDFGEVWGALAGKVRGTLISTWRAHANG